MRLTHYLFLAIALLPVALKADDGTAYPRSVYKDVNERLSQFSSNDFKLATQSEPEKSDVKVWWEASVIRKMVVKTKLDGTAADWRTYEFYYDPKGVMVYATMLMKGKDVNNESQFYYSRDGKKLVKWVDGGESVSREGMAYKDTEQDMITASEEYQAAVNATADPSEPNGM